MGSRSRTIALAACLALIAPVAVYASEDSQINWPSPVGSVISPAAIPAPTPLAPVVNPVAATMPQPPVTRARQLNIADSLHDLHGEQLGRHLDGIVATGAKSVRFDVQWRHIETRPGVYQWAEADEVMSAVLEHGLQPLVIITYAPDWAKNPACHTELCGPAEASAYASFAKEVVKHYQQLHPSAHLDIELWNEANIPEFFGPKANPKLYVHMLCQGYSAIKSVDPQAVVITAGSSPAGTDNTRLAPIDWLRALYHNGARGCFDHVGHHPYTWPRHPLAEPLDAWGQMRAMHQLMTDNGDGHRKIWLTEFGYTTGPHNNPERVSEQVMADYMVATLQAYQSYPWAGPLFWYTYKDGGGDSHEGYFGLVRPDGQPKAAYHVFRSAANIINH